MRDDKYNTIAIFLWASESDPNSYMYIHLMNGYPIGKVIIPPSYIEEKDGEYSLIKSNSAHEWALRTIGKRVDEFWSDWYKTHLKGDEPIKLFGEYFAGTKMERNVILQMFVDIVIALTITALHLYFKETSFLAVGFLVAKMVVYINIFYVLFMIGYRMMKGVRGTAIYL